MDFVMLIGMMVGYIIWRFMLYGLVAIDKAADAAVLKEADPHRIKQLQIEVYGQEWYDLFGDPCDCETCNLKTLEQTITDALTANNHRSMFIPLPPEPRPQYRDVQGFRFPLPDEVPVHAHVEPYFVDGSEFVYGIYQWTDTETGKRMWVKVPALFATEAVWVDQYEKPVGYINYDRALINYHNKQMERVIRATYQTHSDHGRTRGTYDFGPD